MAVLRPRLQLCRERNSADGRLDWQALGYSADETTILTSFPPVAPEIVPTEIPTEVPTDVPTEEPTEVPVEEPTEEPIDKAPGKGAAGAYPGQE